MPDLVVLDWMMPAWTGSTCALRRESDAPVLMLTARDEKADLLLAWTSARTTT